MNVIFTCGGTGGHISPAIAVANLLREKRPDTEILFVGASDGMEADLVPRAGYRLETVEISNFQRKLTPSNIIYNFRSLGYMFSSRRTADRIIREFRPDVIVGTGGYASYPMLRQGAKRGIPTALHEANAVPGLTTRLVMNQVDRVMVSFEESRNAYPHPDKVRVVGMPVKSEFFFADKAGAKAALGLDERPLVVSYWGSLGAREMNKKIARFMALEARDGTPFQHIHATGSYGWKWMPDYVREQGAILENFPAIDMSLETIDLYEGETLNSIILYDIALTDRSADEINKRNAVPDAVRNYALNIKDNGESLETNDFSMEPAIVKGKIYGFDRRTFGEKNERGGEGLYL